MILPPFLSSLIKFCFEITKINSTSGLNGTNQFIMADKITKDLNPEYGSIQKLHARGTDLLALCEDKVVKILAGISRNCVLFILLDVS